jgi:hypothetical protein
MRLLGFLGIAIALLFTTTSFAAKTPYPPEIDKRFYQLEHPSGTTGQSLATGAVLVGNAAGKAAPVNAGTNGNGVLHIAKATYDFSSMGGTIGAISLGVTIPANSTIIRSWIYTVTQVAGATSTVALSCANANDIFSAASMTSITAGTITEGVSTGAASAFKPVTTACPITATIATANLTAGKFNVYTEYVTHD